ncbi:hypothetical protein ACIP2Y_14650 [Streptomyces sviceus]|uniref:hypothetical protein n=1 Tax=Streptomyces sviceus TaxID=285530 RepID=UPI00381D09B3
MPCTTGLREVLVVCDTNHTCAAKIREERLSARETHHGAHDRLRETAVLPRG